MITGSPLKYAIGTNYIMNKRIVLDRLLVAAGFASALFLFLPLVVYLLNLDSVTTSKMTILLCGGLLVVVITGFLTAAMSIPRLGRLIFAACLIGLVTIVLMTVFPNRTGEITGFTSSLPSVQNFWAMAKMFTVCGFCVWLTWKKPQLLFLLSRYCLIVVLLFTVYVVLVPISVADKSVRTQAVVPANFTQLGKASNVIVLVFDSFTGYRMAEVLNEIPSLRAELDGFVYYPSTLSSALSTPAGVGAILTGDLRTSLLDADGKVRVKESLQNSFLSDAMHLGLSAGFISLLAKSDTGIPSISEQAFYEQHSLSIGNRFPAYLGFLALSLSRVTPGNLSSLTSTAAEKITALNQKAASTEWELLQSLQSESERRSLSGKMALDYFVNNLKVTKNPGTVLVLHSMLTHPPNNLTATGKYEVDTGNGYVGTSVYAAKELARLCSKLRDLGVYDSTLIIAVADHGSMNIRDTTMGGKFSPPHQLPLEYNPLLMVKAPNAHGPCRDSSMSVWIGDVATTVRDYLAVQAKPQAMFSSRSLLHPENEQRTLNVPIFFRPDQVGHYASLLKWTRQDFTGTFRDYGAVGFARPEKLLQTKSQVKLFVGVDQLNMKIMRNGWTKDKNIPYRGAIEVNNRLLTKITSSGIAVVTGSNEDGYQSMIFTDIEAGTAFIKSIPSDHDCLVVGLKVPIDFVKQLFPKVIGVKSPAKTVGVIAVSGPSYGLVPKVLVGVDDLNFEILWNPLLKD